jgi:hypothetical protein
MIIPTGIAGIVHKYLDGKLSSVELDYYREGLEILDEFFEDEDEFEELVEKEGTDIIAGSFPERE